MKRIRSARKIAKRINKKFSQDELTAEYAANTYGIFNDCKLAVHFECNDGKWVCVKGA